MLRIIYNSYKRNINSYRFAIIALAMATVVSTLGLSGVNLMANMWRYPMLQGQGGHILITSNEGTRGVNQWNTYSLFSLSKARDIVQEIYPEAEVTATLLVPTLVHGRSDSITGRMGGLDKWYLMSPLASGVGLNRVSHDEPVFVSRQQSLTVPIATLDTSKYPETWQLTGAKLTTLDIVGTSSYPYHRGWAIGHLSMVQNLTNTPDDLVHIVGIALPGLHAKIDEERYNLLRTKLAADMSGVTALSLDQFFDEEFEMLQQLKDAAGLYTPILLIIGLQVIIATALAVAHTRRRELTLLRIMGFSYKQLWLLLTLECTLSALTACGIGIVLGKLVAFILFQSAAISLLPFALALFASMIVAMIVGMWSIAKSVPDVMRNA